MSSELLARNVEMTPIEIVEELDRHIIGQSKAKRMVAVALRNHYRRRRLPPEIQRQVQFYVIDIDRRMRRKG